MKSDDRNTPFARQALYNARAELSRGQLAKAEKILRSVTQVEPDNPVAKLLLATTLLRRGRLQQARRLLEKLVAMGNKSEDTWSQLGEVKMQLGDFDGATNCFRHAVGIDPDSEDSWRRLAGAQLLAGQHDDAIDSFRRAIELWPDYAQAWIELGQLYQIIGDSSNAVICLDKALDVDPKATSAYLLLATSGQLKNNPARVAAMREMYERAALSDEQRSSLAFALARVCESEKNYDQAFEFLLTANRLARLRVRFSVPDESEKFDKIRKYYNAERIASMQVKRKSKTIPVFIIGLPRSGTTLVEQILDSHPEVLGGGELPILERLCKELDQITGMEYPDGLDKLTQDHFRDLGDQYLKELRRQSDTKHVITDKQPNNIKNVGLIRIALPEAKIVHVHRDPMAICTSIWRNHFHSGVAYGNELTELGRYYCLYAKLMSHWRAALGPTMHEVCYETLVDNTDDTIRSMLEYCGLEFDTACLNFHESSRPVRTMSDQQVRRPIYRDAVSAWKHYEAHLGPLVQAIGDRSLS